MLKTSDRERPGLVRRMLRWAKRLVVLALVVLVGLVVAGVVLDIKLRRIDVLTDYPGRPDTGRGTNWLLVGSDSRAGLSAEQEAQLATGGDAGPPHSDTVLLVHLPEGGAATVVSLPRDSYVQIPGESGRNKLNTAYARGGGQLLAQTVELATGLRLDHYAEVGFTGLADLVDALGGVDLCLDEPIADPLAGVDLPQGCQHVSGPQALGVARSRATPKADLDRMAHQRELLSALVGKLGSVWTFADPLRIGALWDALTKDVTFDQGAHVWQLKALADAMGGQASATVVPIGGFADTEDGNVLLWDEEKAKALFASLG